MAKQDLLSGSMWGWMGSFAVHGIFISLLLTETGRRKGQGDRKTV